MTIEELKSDTLLLWHHANEMWITEEPDSSSKSYWYGRKQALADVLIIINCKTTGW